jgi:hypothetical protein
MTSTKTFFKLLQIVTKSGRTDFKIYFTGYPAFFNVDTTYCNDITFFYWAPHHRPAPINDGYTYLSQQLRLQLNNLLMSLNQFLSGLVNDFNAQRQFQNKPPVVFVPLIRHSTAIDSASRVCKSPIFYILTRGSSSAAGLITTYLARPQRLVALMLLFKATQPHYPIQILVTHTATTRKWLSNAEPRKPSPSPEVKRLKYLMRICRPLPRATFQPWIFHGGCRPDKGKHFIQRFWVTWPIKIPS